MTKGDVEGVETRMSQQWYWYI